MSSLRNQNPEEMSRTSKMTREMGLHFNGEKDAELLLTDVLLV
jgi:hypothetical protein